LNPLELKYEIDRQILFLLEISGGEGYRKEIFYLCVMMNLNYNPMYFEKNFNKSFEFLVKNGYVREIKADGVYRYRIGEYERSEEWREKVNELFDRLKDVLPARVASPIISPSFCNAIGSLRKSTPKND